MSTIYAITIILINQELNHENYVISKIIEGKMNEYDSKDVAIALVVLFYILIKNQAKYKSCADRNKEWGQSALFSSGWDWFASGTDQKWK